MAVGAAARADKSQERFENALRDLFVGANLQYTAHSMQYAGSGKNG